MQMQCYRVTLKTTNALGNVSEVAPGEYTRVANGHVYVVAPNIEDAAKLLPVALAVEEIGPAYPDREG